MSRAYTALVAADVYRDGGSIEVRFACKDGREETIWLKVGDTPEGVFVHTELLVCVDSNHHHPAHAVAKDSAEEHALLAALHRFLSRPTVDVPFVRRTEDGHYLAILENLVASIPNRIVRPDVGPSEKHD